MENWDFNGFFDGENLFSKRSPYGRENFKPECKNKINNKSSKYYNSINYPLILILKR